jgi:hypothetical protein
MADGTALLVPNLHRDTTVLITATKTFGEAIGYWDKARTDGRIVIRPRRRTSFSRRRAAQSVLLRNPQPLEIVSPFAVTAG